MMVKLPLFLLALASSAIATPLFDRAVAAPSPFNSSTIALVRKNALGLSQKSWEFGTVAEAIRELAYGNLSVYTPNTFPPPASKYTNSTASYPFDVINITNYILSIRPAGLLPLMVDGAVGDPASNGNGMLLANFTQKVKGYGNYTYIGAASDQLNYLTNVAPKAPNGAISHRGSEAQLWSDFVYMVPPFLAEAGLWVGGSQGDALLQSAYDQCRLYRDVMLAPSVGLWRHVLLGSWNDTSIWGTGNAWAAAGMMRVLQSIKKSPSASSFASQQAYLQIWISEILTNTYKYQKSDGSIPNHITNSTDFSDSATTALISATTFRYASFTKSQALVSNATAALNYIKTKVDSKGYLLGCVDPLSWNVQLKSNRHSPEGQSFVLLLQAAVADYVSPPKKQY